MKLDEAVTTDEGIRHFVTWALETLGVSVTVSDRDDATFGIPDHYTEYFRGAKSAQLVYAGAAISLSPHEIEPSPADDSGQLAPRDVTLVPVDTEFLAWLSEQLNCAAKVPYAVPTLPAIRVHEISAQIFQAYTVDGGTMHLGGCTLEDRPLLRQTWLDSGGSGQVRLVHRFSDPRGVGLREAEIAVLGLESLQSPAGSLPLVGHEDVHVWCEVARQHLTATGDAIPPGAASVASVIWCQYVAGKIEFVIGDASAEVAFSGWARQLAAGLVDPPPFQCPVTGISSHAIAATDDGRITAREAIQVCAISGRRVFVSDLEECEQTGQAVLPEYLVTCPVSGRRILESALETCRTCQQPVDPACLEQGICEACRTMIPVRKDDPRMARVLGEYPRLDRWSNWRIGETSTSYVLVAAALIKRILVVVNKESLEMVRLATRNRFSSHWVEPPLTERQEFLS